MTIEQQYVQIKRKPHSFDWLRMRFAAECIARENVFFQAYKQALGR